MKPSIGSAIAIIAIVSSGCSKKETPSTSASASAPLSISSAAPIIEAKPVAISAPSTASAAPANDGDATKPPENFSGADAVANPVATGLSCEAKSKDGWLQLLCRKKNGAGGHPKRAVMGTEADAPETLPDGQGELTVVVPYHSGAETTGVIEWTDTKYNLNVKDGELKLDWVVTLEMRRACAELDKASKELVTKAQKSDSPEKLTAMEASKLPHFGTCQPAGHGSWALALRSVDAAGADAARAVSLGIDVVRVGEDGVLSKADFGTVTTRPGGFEIRPLQIYDYDDDGQVELIVPHDVKAIAAGATASAFSAVWSAVSGQVTAFAGFAPAKGGVQTTHLEYDMRPDLSRYEPFVAYLGDDCGAASCPPRLVGPARFARSLAKGEFSLTDPQAMASLKRACPKVASVVAEGNPTRTAQLVGCARLQGEEKDKLVTELKAKGAKICKGTDTCLLLDALLQFANTDVANP